MPDVASQDMGLSFSNQRSMSLSSPVSSHIDHPSSSLRKPRALKPKRSDESSRPEVIEEVSEPASPDKSPSIQGSTHSVLSEMLRQSPGSEGDLSDLDDEASLDQGNVQSVVVEGGIISQPKEETTSLLKKGR